MEQIKYEKLELEVIRFEAEDVITESPFGNTGNGNGLPPEKENEV